MEMTAENVRIYRHQCHVKSGQLSLFQKMPTHTVLGLQLSSHNFVQTHVGISPTKCGGDYSPVWHHIRSNNSTGHTIQLCQVPPLLKAKTNQASSVRDIRCSTSKCSQKPSEGKNMQNQTKGKD